jgi:hypothetical protein
VHDLIESHALTTRGPHLVAAALEALLPALPTTRVQPEAVCTRTIDAAEPWEVIGVSSVAAGQRSQAHASSQLEVSAPKTTSDSLLAIRKMGCPL